MVSSVDYPERQGRRLCQQIMFESLCVFSAESSKLKYINLQCVGVEEEVSQTDIKKKNNSKTSGIIQTDSTRKYDSVILDIY